MCLKSCISLTRIDKDMHTKEYNGLEIKYPGPDLYEDEILSIMADLHKQIEEIGKFPDRSLFFQNPNLNVPFSTRKTTTSDAAMIAIAATVTKTVLRSNFRVALDLGKNPVFCKALETGL